MPVMRNNRTVPRDAANPIAWLLANGRTRAELAVEWGLGTTSTVDRLHRLSHVPRYRTAEKMAKTFGWDSAGEVMDFYAARVARQKRSA